jgi:hypothetical protein
MVREEDGYSLVQVIAAHRRSVWLIVMMVEECALLCVCVHSLFDAAPKVEYYHEVQAFDDKTVDRAARAIIDNPERRAYRKRLKDQKRFTKVVGSTLSILKTHNKGLPKPKKQHHHKKKL